MAPALGYGGVSTIASLLTRAWARGNRRIEFCASDESRGGRLRAEDVRLGDQVRVRLYRCYWFRRWGFGLGAVPMLLGLCTRAGAIYIHGIATWPTTLAGIFCALFGRHFVVAPRGGLMPDYLRFIRRKKRHKWWYYRLLTLPAIRRAAAIHCTSELEAFGVRSLLGADAPVVVVPNGLTTRDYAVLPKVRGRGLTLCYLGHIHREKGINRFAKLWLASRGSGDRLIVAGGGADESYFSQFERLVDRAGGAIDYRGYVARDEVRAILAVSDFLVLPSGIEPDGGLRENFGNVVLEAMAAGRPVLVTRGLPWDAVEPRGAGFVYDTTDESILAAIERARGLTRWQWTEMSWSARAYVEQTFEMERLAERLWDRLVERRGGTPVAA